MQIMRLGFSRTGMLGSAALIGIALTTASGNAAFAQNWNGTYAGVSLGYGMQKDHWAPQGAQDFWDNARGAIGGVQAGYNWQSGSVLAGIEGDYLFSGIKGSTTCAGTPDTCSTNLNGLGSVRGRLGWVATPSAMFYFTGGLAWGSLQYKDTVAGGVGFTHTSTGAVLGAGSEFMLSRNWTLKAEYLHYDLGKITAGAADFSGTPTDFRVKTDTFRLGLNYKF